MPKKLPKTESVRVCKGREPGVNPSSIGEQTRSERTTTKSGLLARNPGPLIGRSVPRGRAFLSSPARWTSKPRRARARDDDARARVPRRDEESSHVDALRTSRLYRIARRKRPREETRRPRTFTNARARLLVVRRQTRHIFVHLRSFRRGDAERLDASARTHARAQPRE